MSVKKTILTNTAWLTGSRIINNIIGYILIVAIARTLGDVGLGQYSFVFAFASLIFIIGDFGIPYLIIKEVSRNQKKRQYYFENTLTLRFALGVLSLLIAVILSLISGKSLFIIQTLWVVFLIQFIQIFDSLFNAFFNSMDRMDFNAKSTVIERVIALIFGLYILINTKNLLYFISVLLLSNTLKILYLLFIIKDKVDFKIRIDFKDWKKILTISFPYFLTGVFTLIYFRIDTIMLSFMQGDMITGWYTSAYKLIDVLTFVPMILIAAILPSMSKLYKQNKKILRNLFERTFRYLLIIIIPIAIATTILAGRFIDFIYGKSFIGGEISLKILIWAEVFLFVNYLMGHLLNSIDKQRYFTTITGICALLNVILNFILIPTYSYVGAAIATVLTEALNFYLLRKYVTNYLISVKIKFYFIKILISAVLMGILISFIKFLPIWYIIPMGAISYFLFLYLFRLEKEDNELLKQIINFLKIKIKGLR